MLWPYGIAIVASRHSCPKDNDSLLTMDLLDPFICFLVNVQILTGLLRPGVLPRLADAIEVTLA